MKRLNNKGFTLLEMVIVIVIIAILAAILVPSLLAYVDDSKNATLKGTGKTIYECVCSEIAEESKDGIVFEESSDDYSNDFWKKISQDAGVVVNADNVSFTFTNQQVKDFTYTESEKMAYLDNQGVWQIKDLSK